jgi:predicted nucleic acid-binding protein
MKELQLKDAKATVSAVVARARDGAATAAVRGFTVLTANERHFAPPSAYPSPTR